MKKIGFQIVLFSIIAVLLSLIGVIVFTLPALNQQLNVSDKGNIGSAIGGITAPIIGIGTAVLLYLAFMKQVESNKEQRFKNESDVIFLLLNQLNAEVEQFYHSFTQGENTFRYTGVEGLNKFIKSLQTTNFASLKNSFRGYFEASHLMLLIRSYNLIEQRIETSILSDDLKQMFRSKLDVFYYSILRFPLTGIITILSKHEKMKDEITNEIEAFVKDKPKTPWVTFGMKENG